MVWPSLADEARRLMIVDAFHQVAMAECIFDIELVHRPSARRGEVEHGVDGRRFHHRGECLVEINAQSLREAMHNPACLTPF